MSFNFPVSLSIIGALVIALVPFQAEACSCVAQSPCETLTAASTLVQAEILSLDTVQGPPGTAPEQLQELVDIGAASNYYVALVSAVFKGSPQGVAVGSNITVVTPSNSAVCGFNFQIGQTYLLELAATPSTNPTSYSLFRTGLCTATQLWSSLSADLQNSLESGEDCQESTVCDASPVCTSEYKPICGSDDTTYENDCLFQQARCERKDLIVSHAGVCDPKNPLECAQLICKSLSEPVCASNDRTYDNECFFKLARCQNESLSIVSEGSCVRDELTSPPVSECDLIFCTSLYQPVCGTDEETYENECFLRKASCESPSSISIEHAGVCDPLTPEQCDQLICKSLYQPVCGSNNQTYENSCFLKQANCQDGNITQAADGACAGQSCDQIVCTSLYEPVCASNGKTYENECFLKKANCEDSSIVAVGNGTCEDQIAPSPAPTNRYPKPLRCLQKQQ